MSGKFIAGLILLGCVALQAQDKSDKFAVFVTGLGDAAPVAQSLIKQINATKPFKAVGQNDESKVVVEDWAILALFVALLRTRNPAFDKDENEFTEQFHRWWAKARHPSVEVTEESLREHEKETGEDMSDVSAQEIFEMIRDDTYVIDNPRQNNIKMMMSLSLKIAQAVFSLNWEIFAPPKGCSFITCDNPFTVVPPPNFDDSLGGYGILTPGASTIVPLSSKTAISFYGEGDRTRGAVLYKSFLRNVNVVVAANSERFVIARDEPLLRSVVRKGQLDRWQRPPQFQINAPNPYAGFRGRDAGEENGDGPDDRRDDKPPG